MKNSTITVVARDKAGVLSEVTGILADKGVNIESISLNTTGRNAVIRVTTSSVRRAKTVLRAKGFKPFDSNVLVVNVKDKTGELARVCSLLKDAGIRVKQLHLLSRGRGQSLLAFETSDNARARKLLRRL